MDLREYLDIISSKGVFKLVDDDSLLSGGLKAMEQLDKFIRVIEERSPVLEEATLRKMNSFETEISAIDAPRGYLYPGRVGADKIIPGEEGTDEFTVVSQGNVLNAQEFVMVVSIDFNTLEDTIEGPDFEQTVTELMANAASLDLETVFLRGDTSLTIPSGNPLLKTLDGWIKKAANKVYGYTHDGASPDFDPNGSDFPIDMFAAMEEAMPKRYLTPREELRFYVDWETYAAYRDIIAGRETSLGDEALLGRGELSYDGIPVRHVPSLDDETATGLTGKQALLARPASMVWGVFREITVESDRRPRERVVEHVLTFRGDCTYSDVNSAVAALISEVS